MKLTRKNIIRFRLLFIFVNIFFSANVANAQDVNITVNVLPPYQLNFTDYRSRPNQLLIVVTNRTSNNLNLQLSGSIEGDNGVRLNTIPGTRSNQPVRLGPLETRSLSVFEIENLFDINQIQFQGISQQSIARNGILPEGNYTLCVMAQDYRTLVPLSAANPSGCSNIFPINSLEAPVILKPFDEEEVSPLKPQNIVFTWTTPPNTPPGAYYIFNLVELLNDQQAPGAAIQTKTGINNFETRVYGNAFLFGPDQFPLTNNKRYAVQVTVVDPAGKSLYRNNGKSEVIVFNYGNTPLASSPPTKQQTAPPIKDKKPVTTNRISGKIGWAFLESEENFKSPINEKNEGGLVSSKVPNVNAQTTYRPIVTDNPMPLVDKKAAIISIKDASFLGGNVGGINFGINEPIKNKLVSNSGKYSIDLSAPDFSNSKSYLQNYLFPAPSFSQYVVGNFSKPEYSLAGVAGKLSANVHPLQVSLVLLGVRNTHEIKLGNTGTNVNGNSTGNVRNVVVNGTSQNNNRPVTPAVTGNTRPTTNTSTTNQPANANQINGIVFNNNQYQGMDLLGSTRSNAAGEFNLDFISAEFLNTTKYNKFILRVITPEGFAKLELDISRTQLKDSNFNIGQLIAQAISHRITINASEEGEEPKTATANSNSSNNSSSNNSILKKVSNNLSINNLGISPEGKFKYEIYRKKADIDRMPFLAWEGNLNGTLPATSVINGINYIQIATYGTRRTAARIFHTGTYLVRLSNNDTTKFAISNMEVVCNKKSEEIRPVEVTLSKKILLQMPVINGQVKIQIGTQDIIGIPNVLVRVKFDKNDLDVSAPGSLLVNLPGSIFSSTYTGNLPASSSGIINNRGPEAYINSLDESSFEKDDNKNFAGTPVRFVQTSNTGIQKEINVNTAALNGFTNSYFTLPQYSTLTDSMGNYVIGNLPVLLPGKTYQVEIGRLPAEYKNLPVVNSNIHSSAAIGKGEQATVDFTIIPKIGLITATVVDENKVPLPFALLQFKGAANPFEANENGVFTVQYISGKQKLIISKEGYVTEEVDVTIPENANSNSGTSNSGNIAISPSNIGTYLNGQTKNTLNALGVSNTDANNLINNNTPEVAYQTGLALKNNKTFTSNSVTQNAYGNSNGSLNASFNYVSGGTGNISTGVPNSGIVNNATFGSVAAALGVSPMGTITAQTALGNIGFLKEKFGRAKILVVDKATGNAIANAQVKLFDTIYITNTNGEALHKGRGGAVTITVYPAAESLFAPAQIASEVLSDGTETIIKIQLQKGVRVNGKVTSGGSMVAEANISIIGSDFIKTKTNSSGIYSLVMASGNADLKAGRQGYIGKQKNIVIQNTDIQNFDFDLEGGNGKNISTLLGFDIELESKTTQGAKESWSGSFINLTPKNNSFSAAPDLKIKFSNVLISYDANGNAVPEGAGVKTDATSIPLKLFNWLPINIEDASGVMVLKDNAAADKGKIGGKINVDLTRLGEVRGLGFNQALKPSLTIAGSSTIVDIFPFTSATANSGNQSFAFATTSGNKLQMSLYGFTVEADLSKTTIATDKINFKGKISTPNLGIIQATSFDVDELTVSNNFKITSTKITLNNNKITIGSWQATLSNLSLGDNGFKLAGQLKLTLPASKESIVNFDNLSVGKEAVFGGAFSFPSGIDIFNAVQFKTGTTPFSFGKVGNSSVYRLSGSGNIHFNKYFTKDISIPVFQVQTDGKFNLNVPVNISQDLAFAKFAVTGITFNSIASVPYVGVTGDINLDLPIIKLTAGDFKFYSNGKVIPGEVGVSLTVPGFTGSGSAKILENGFEGKGNLRFAALFGVDFGMHYYKLERGYDFGANFEAHIPVVIGLVTIESFGGGFAYNTQTDYFEVSVTGSASFTGTGAIVALNNLRLKVNSDMVITGGVDVRAFTLFDVAGAAITIDIPQAYFAVNVYADVEPIKGLARAHAEGLLIISGKKGDSFAFLGAAIKVNVLSLIYADGKFAAGIAVSNATQREETREFFDENDAALLGNNFTGIYASGKTKLGVDEDHAVGVDLGFVSVEAWYSTKTAAGFLLNFSNQTVVARLSGSVNYGLKVKFLRVTVAGGKVGVCINVEGGYVPTRGVFFNGTAQGFVSMNGGLCEPDDCNSICKALVVPAGIKLCAGAKVTLGFSQLPYADSNGFHYSGFDFSIGLSGPKVNCD